MMDGIFAGGKYVPNCGKVTLYAHSTSTMNWYWPSDYSTRVNKNMNRVDTGIMRHAAPVILAFWSDEE